MNMETNDLGVIARFYNKINFEGGLAPAMDTKCWQWTGPKGGTRSVYGRFPGAKLCVGDVRRKKVQAHRFAYALIVGSVSDGLVLDHLCHNKMCVNPSHLEPVTPFVNAQRCRGSYRTNASCGIRGVTWNKQVRKWQVGVKHKGISYYGGIFAQLSVATEAAIRLRESVYGIDLQRMDYREVSA